MALIPAPDAAVFDFDGVIIDSREAVRIAINAALSAHGLPTRAEHELDRFLGPPTLIAFAELTGEDAASEFVARCVDTYHERYAAVYLERTHAVDGIGDVLARLTLPLALATSKPAEFTRPLLAKLGLAERFSVVTAPGLSALDEPKSVTVSRALQGLGAGDAVVIGDRSFDVEGAHANGLRAVGVTWGIGDRAELTGAGADVIVEQPAQLVPLLEPGG
jgi:phosphoglycolate phosphatase